MFCMENKANNIDQSLDSNTIWKNGSAPQQQVNQEQIQLDGFKLKNTSEIWTENVKIKAHEVDFHRHATLESICRHFQEAAWNHADSLGVGYKHLKDQQKIWVLSRLQIMFEQYPQWGDSIRVITWPRTVESLFAMRDFEIETPEGKRIVAGNSAYLAIHSETHRPQRVEKLLANLPQLSHRCALPESPEKLPEMTDGDCQFTFRVGFSDIDMHYHVNNTRYVGWLLDAYSMDYHSNHQVVRIEINYLGEARCGDILAVKTCQMPENVYDHLVYKVENNMPICRARFYWRLISETMI